MSTFNFKDNRSFKDKTIYFLKGLIFWKGRPSPSGYSHTRNLEWEDLRFIFFPKGFEEKYGYLGTGVGENSRFFKSLYPLVLTLDYEAKPKWCPRWFLRFLHVFGADKSIVRVRNFALYNLLNRLTKGIAFVDWKTKWTDYDLRISIHAPGHINDLANAIEEHVYRKGQRKELQEQILKLDPTASIMGNSISELKRKLDELQSDEK
jgi:hypothetical protein